MDRSKLLEICCVIPCVQRYIKKGSQLPEGALCKEVEIWIKSFLKPSVLSKSINSPIEDIIMSKMIDSGWLDICYNIFHILDIPVKKSYRILNEVAFLDSMLYKILNPIHELSREQINDNIIKNGGWPVGEEPLI